MLKYPSDHPIFKIKIFAKLFNLDKLVVFIQNRKKIFQMAILFL